MALVLVVDDDGRLLGVLADLLEAMGHRALTAANGAQALEKAKDQPPDLIITDLNMPGMNGLELITALRCGAGVPPATPIVLMTSMVVPEGSQADAHLVKPFDISQLTALLERFLAGGDGRLRASL